MRCAQKDWTILLKVRIHCLKEMYLEGCREEKIKSITWKVQILI